MLPRRFARASRIASAHHFGGRTRARPSRKPRNQASLSRSGRTAWAAPPPERSARPASTPLEWRSCRWGAPGAGEAVIPDQFEQRMVGGRRLGWVFCREDRSNLFLFIGLCSASFGPSDARANRHARPARGNSMHLTITSFMAERAVCPQSRRRLAFTFCLRPRVAFSATRPVIVHFRAERLHGQFTPIANKTKACQVDFVAQVCQHIVDATVVRLLQESGQERRAGHR